MDPLIHILHLEDDPADAELARARLDEDGLTYRITRVQTRLEFDEALGRAGYDIILADYRLPTYDGMSALRLALERCPDIPFIFVSGAMGEEAAIEGLIAGATDYVLKQKLSRLAPAIKRALQEAENRRARRWAEEDLRVSHRFLEIANRHREMAPLLTEFTSEVRTLTGCEAVGIRVLDEGGHIPYQAYDGFSRSFYESESPLSITSDRCMCINVIKGATDPKLPFYTEGGSFYMNGTTRFLATVPEAEKGQTRNVCNQSGYESVALVPIRSADRILGLIHIADHRENRVPLETVEALESVALQLGTALQRVRAEEALMRSEWEKDILNRVANIFLTVPDEEIYGEVLTVVREAMSSRFGIFGFIADNGDLVIPSMTRDVWKECLVAGKSVVFPSDAWGGSVWGKAIREKRAFYSVGPFLTPAGHIRIDNFLTAPIVFGDDTIGLLSVANRENGYSEDDKTLLESITKSISPILNARMERDRKESDRKRAETQVEHLKNYLANIIDSMPSALVGMDQNSIVTQWNRRAEEMSGISSTDAIGRPITHVFSEFSSWIAGVWDDVEKHRPASMEKLPIEKGGKRHFYDLMLYPLLANGVEGAVLCIEDVTEKTRIQELMVQTEKMMSLGGLAAGMAHEINNPLGIITQAIQNIERRVLADLPANREAAEGLGIRLEGIRAYFEKRQIPEFTGSIREASIRASRIIANILRFSRRGEAALQPGLLEGVLEQSLELAANDYDLKKKYDFKSIEIIRDYAPGMPEVPMASVEMEQVLLNLLKNAAQAMIENPPDRKPRITLRLRREERYAVLEVADNGAGMAEEIRRRVFEPFFTTKEPGIGTGLGLSVSYMIVTQNHKGLMEVTSVPGKGACFKIRLPVLRQKTNSL